MPECPSTKVSTKGLLCGSCSRKSKPLHYCVSGSAHPRVSFVSVRLFNVGTGTNGNQFRRFGGSHSDDKFGFGHTNMPAGVNVKLSHASEPAISDRVSTQATTLRRTQQERRSWNTAHAMAIAGHSHGRVVVARSVPEILSAGDTKRKATSNFAAFRRQEHTQKSTPR